MNIFLSTTFYDDSPSCLSKVLDLISGFDLDGVELGSTHQYQEDFYDLIKTKWSGRLQTHNFFPPASDLNFVVNLASDDSSWRQASIDHAEKCLKFSAEIGAEIYTVHPGFLASPERPKGSASKEYDFSYSRASISHELAFNNMLDSLEALATVASRLGVNLAVETEGSFTKQGVLLLERMEEYERLFSKLDGGVVLNCNLAHTRLAGKVHGYELADFIDVHFDRIVCAELSHNDGISDQHLPLVEQSYVFDYVSKLPDVPMILEFRNTQIAEVEKSIALMRSHSAKGAG